MLLCSCCESLEGIGVRREEDDSYLGVDEWFQALHSIIPTLDSFEDVGGLLLMKFLSKCVFWVYFASIWAFSNFLWWEVFWKVEEMLLMQNLTVLTVFYIVYGCSIADENSEVSESEMNQFWPYLLPHLSSAYPHLLRWYRRIIVDGIFEEMLQNVNSDLWYGIGLLLRWNI